MKKYICMFIVTIMIVLMMIVIPSTTVQAKNITAIEATQNDSGKIDIRGTAEAGTLAVAITVYDKDENLIAVESTGVADDNTFGYEIEVPNGEYIVKVADYDGGTYKTAEVVIDAAEEKTDEEGLEEYTLNSGDVTIIFKDEEGHTYEATIFDIMILNDEELEAFGITREEYEEAKKIIEEAAKEYGDLVAVYVIEVADGPRTYSDAVPIKVKLTDELKEYNTFKFIYIDDSEGFVKKEVVDATVEDGYIVAKLPHLSVYALAATYVEPEETAASSNPKTGDQIVKYVVIFAVAVVGLAIVAKAGKKKEE